jgi:hypothetical protein
MRGTLTDTQSDGMDLMKYAVEMGTDDMIYIPKFK